MIRRTFLKALCESPLGFLIPKARSDGVPSCWTSILASDGITLDYCCSINEPCELHKRCGLDAIRDSDYTYTFTRQIKRTSYIKSTCGGADLAFLRDTEVLNHSTNQWQKMFEDNI